MTLQINHTTASALTFGMAPTAGTIPATPGVNDAAAWLAADGALLSSDLRESQDWSEWRLKVASGTTVNWNVTDVPASRVLLLQQIDVGTDQPLPGTTLDLAVATGFTTATGATRYFRLTCAPPAAYDLNWHAGWNFISLPLEPRNPQAAAIFAANLDKVMLNSVFSWENGQYRSATELHAQRGYCLYAFQDGNVTVTGGAATGIVNLQPGWNLLGPAATVATSALAYPLNTTTAWGWDRTAYRTFTELLPGSAYWLCAPANGPAYPAYHLGR